MTGPKTGAFVISLRTTRISSHKQYDRHVMTPTPQIYLSFNGRCEAAFRFYEQHLGATRARMFPYANSPMAGDVPAGWETKIMHGAITLGGVTVSGADLPTGRYEQPKGFRIFLETDDPAAPHRRRSGAGTVCHQAAPSSR